MTKKKPVADECGEAPIFKVEQYIDATGRNLTTKLDLAKGSIAYIGHVTGQIPLNLKQVANVPHDFEIEAESVEHAFQRFDEVAGATWPLHKEAAIAEMRAQAQQQQAQPRIVRPGMKVPAHMGRMDQGGPH